MGKSAKFAIVCMPFFGANRPSLQLGLLKSVLTSHSVPTDDLYLNVDFASEIGATFYAEISNCCDLLLGEWLFSRAAFGFPADSAYLDALEAPIESRFPETAPKLKVPELLLKLRDQTVAQWLDRISADHDWAQYRVVGFSCTFSQIVPSLALAKRIREVAPETKIVFGGSALEGSMGAEVVRRAPWIDSVVQGEGEHAIVEIWKLANDERPLPRIYNSKQATVLEELPLPDYDTYYSDLASAHYLQSAPESVGALSFEASRGCWWGEKHHCTFCGLNGETMTFREKSPARVLSELAALSHRYGRTQFQAVDNILSHRYFETLLPKLAEQEVEYQLFFETKSNLSLDKVRLLYRAGVRQLQPGIESLDSAVLRLMKKGVTAIQNIETLKWSRQEGMQLTWNYLYGFPGESVQSYLPVIAFLPQLWHLQPPDFAGPMRMDRFSPYFAQHLMDRKLKTDAGNFTDVGPSPLYAFCYPADWDFEQLAYFFMARPLTQVPPEIYSRLREQIEAWQARWREAVLPRLEFRRKGKSGTIVDSRTDRSGIHFALNGDYLTVALSLEARADTVARVAESTGLSTEVVAQTVEQFRDHGLAIEVDGRWVWLPVGESA